MSDRQYALSVPQVNALVRALEQCGVNKGTMQTRIAAFNDVSLISAAEAAYRILRGQGRPIGEPGMIEVRDRYRAMREDYMALLSDAAELLKHSTAAIRVLSESGADRETRARSFLTEGMQDFQYGESGLAQKLAALESERREEKV